MINNKFDYSNLKGFLKQLWAFWQTSVVPLVAILIPVLVPVCFYLVLDNQQCSVERIGLKKEIDEVTLRFKKLESESSGFLKNVDMYGYVRIAMSVFEHGGKINENHEKIKENHGEITEVRKTVEEKQLAGLDTIDHIGLQVKQFLINDFIPWHRSDVMTFIKKYTSPQLERHRQMIKVIDKKNGIQNEKLKNNARQLSKLNTVLDFSKQLNRIDNEKIAKKINQERKSVKQNIFQVRNNVNQLQSNMKVKISTVDERLDKSKLPMGFLYVVVVAVIVMSFIVNYWLISEIAALKRWKTSFEVGLNGKIQQLRQEVAETSGSQLMSVPSYQHISEPKLLTGHSSLFSVTSSKRKYAVVSFVKGNIAKTLTLSVLPDCKEETHFVNMAEHPNHPIPIADKYMVFVGKDARNAVLEDPTDIVQGHFKVSIVNHLLEKTGFLLFRVVSVVLTYDKQILTFLETVALIYIGDAASSKLRKSGGTYHNAKDIYQARDHPTLLKIASAGHFFSIEDKFLDFQKHHLKNILTS